MSCVLNVIRVSDSKSLVIYETRRRLLDVIWKYKNSLSPMVSALGVISVTVLDRDQLWVP